MRLTRGDVGTAEKVKRSTFARSFGAKQFSPLREYLPRVNIGAVNGARLTSPSKNSCWQFAEACC